MSKKRLARPTGEGRVIAGVCAGLGNYFNIDPVFVRILFVAGVVFFSVSPLLYIILWVVMPKAGLRRPLGLWAALRLPSRIVVLTLK